MSGLALLLAFTGTMHAMMNYQPKLALLPVPDKVGGTGKLPPRSDTKERYIRDSLALSSGEIDGRVDLRDCRKCWLVTIGLLFLSGPVAFLLDGLFLRDETMASTRLSRRDCSACESMV